MKKIYNILNYYLLKISMKNIIIHSLNPNYIYLPFDCYDRNIALIIYIPNHMLLKSVLDKNNTNIILNFPIFSPLIK